MQVIRRNKKPMIRFKCSLGKSHTFLFRFNSYYEKVSFGGFGRNKTRRKINTLRTSFMVIDTTNIMEINRQERTREREFHGKWQKKNPTDFTPSLLPGKRNIEREMSSNNEAIKTPCVCVARASPVYQRRY